ncbi:MULTISPECIES: flavin reductase family protein [unclassified Salinibacterium]|uniref:flavin reductase family protein n=1 Tax=unclassified Salinibacterium TaxID=2632331 RepID=UPI001421EDBD|nr:MULTISPECIES: flavin reductase family protein [unclassified Salinibacterium]
MTTQDTLDPTEYRSALGGFATGVTIVTTKIDGVAYGATVNAFTSVSMNPPLVLVSLDRRSNLCTRLAGRPFVVNVLAHNQESLAWHFAGRSRFEPHEIPWEAVDADSPFAPLKGTVASFRCSPWAEYDGGDHSLFIGEVRAFTRTYGDPLLFHSGMFSMTAENIRHGLHSTL